MVEAKIYDNGELAGYIKGNLLVGMTLADREEFGSDGETAVVGDGSRADMLEIVQAIVQHMADFLDTDYKALLLTLLVAGKRDTEAVPLND